MKSTRLADSGEKTLDAVPMMPPAKMALRLLLRRLARRGIISWRGGKPKGCDPLVTLTPGPDISDYIIEDRR